MYFISKQCVSHFVSLSLLTNVTRRDVQRVRDGALGRVLKQPLRHSFVALGLDSGCAQSLPQLALEFELGSRMVYLAVTVERVARQLLLILRLDRISGHDAVR